MTRRTAIAGAAAAFVAQSAALAATALWAGFRLGRFSASLAATPPATGQQTARPALHIVGNVGVALQ